MHVCIYKDIYIHIHTYIYTEMHTYIYIYICIHVISFTESLIIGIVLPIREINRPTKLIITDILQYRRKVGKTFLSSILFVDILLDSRVVLKVQKLFTNATITPICYVYVMHMLFICMYINMYTYM
jgi:hypothetical protein